MGRRVAEAHSDGHSHGHAHSHGASGPARASRTTVTVLASVVGALLVATVVGLVLLWPPPVTPPKILGDPYAGVDFVASTITKVERTTCDGSSSDRLPDGTIPSQVACARATVTVDDDAVVGAGEVVVVAVPNAVLNAGIGVGDRLRLGRFPPSDGEPAIYSYADVERRSPLTVLAIGFAVLVVVVARLKGLASMAGLALAYLMIGLFVIPALLAGSNPVLVAVVASSAIMTVLLYLAHGVTVKTTTALLGTLTGLAATAGVATWATHATGLIGLDNEAGIQLSQLTTGAGIGGVILCGVIIAGLGVLNDVTISQASAVWELHAAAPHLSAGRLFTAGMRIGRDHLASVVYTIAFVYAGAALPTLMLETLYRRPLADTLVSGPVAEELVRTLVTSSSLVLTIPLTTAVAALLAASSKPGRAPAPPAGARPGI